MKIILIPLLAALLGACTSNKVNIIVSNPTDINRSYEMVEISLETIDKQIHLHPGESYMVKKQNLGIIPSQVTFDKKLIFQAGLKEKESASFSIEKGKEQSFKPMVYGRLISERKDDFAWENDRVAFRVYGQALIPTDGPSNGIDLWYKRTGELIIDKWYRQDLAGAASYHDDHGEGLDDYKVGRTLGGGAMAPYIDGKLWLNENFVSHEILENGPLRLTFKLTYKDMEINGDRFSESRTFSLDAGSQLTKIQQEYGIRQPMPVAAGIVKRENNDSVIFFPEKNYLIYTESSPKAGDVFLALVFPESMKNFAGEIHNHLLVIETYQPGQPQTYYTGYGWTKFGFPKATDFEKYAEDFTICLKQPLIVKVQH